MPISADTFLTQITENNSDGFWEAAYWPLEVGFFTVVDIGLQRRSSPGGTLQMSLTITLNILTIF